MIYNLPNSFGPIIEMSELSYTGITVSPQNDLKFLKEKYESFGYIFVRFRLRIEQITTPTKPLNRNEVMKSYEYDNVTPAAMCVCDIK